MEFKDKVLKVRGQLFISQEQLAKDLDCSFSTINRWEHGKKQPSFYIKRNLRATANKKALCLMRQVNRNGIHN